MHAVDGYYKVGTSEIRQIRTYDVKTSEEARLRAIEDGLTRGILVEQYLGEKEQCALCMNSTTMTI